jgi:outer membrane protein assembly factor BamE (lipoprotein component of BamABCDE complex)
MKTRKNIKEINQLLGKNREEIYSLLGTPDYSEFGDMQLIYITRSWFRKKALVIDLDMDETVESVYTT